MQVLSVKSDRAARSSNDSIICMSIISIIVIMIIIIIFHRKVPSKVVDCCHDARGQHANVLRRLCVAMPSRVCRSVQLDDCRQSLQRHRFRLVGAGSSRSSSCHDIADG